MNDDEYNPDLDPMENVGRALFLIGRNLGAIASMLTTDSTAGGTLAEKVETLGEEIRNLAEATRGNDDPFER